MDALRIIQRKFNFAGTGRAEGVDYFSQGGDHAAGDGTLQGSCAIERIKALTGQMGDQFRGEGEPEIPVQ